MTYRNMRTAATLFILLGVAGIQSACTGSGPINSTSSEKIVWPAGQVEPRIAYVGSVSQPKDMGISQGLMGVLKAMAMGKEDTSMILPMAVKLNDQGQMYVDD